MNKLTVFGGIVSISTLTMLLLIATQNAVFPYMTFRSPLPRSYHKGLQRRGFYSGNVRGLPFSEAMDFFNWTAFQDAVVAYNNTEKIQTLSQSLINLLTPYIIMPPSVLINNTCRPPPLPTHSCNKLKPSNRTRKVGVLLQFGFDADILEIHMNELDDLVDKFFILESTRAHYKALKKPLIWELLKTQPRFAKFVPKVVHSVIDDTEISAEELRIKSSGKSLDYGIENLQEKRRWENFLTWNRANEFFGDEDILGFGDSDEIPSRENIHYLKECGISGDSIDIGIWFPFGSIDQAFKTDWPVPNHPYTYGDPTYYTFKSAKAYEKENGKFPTRHRGQSASYLLGGIHMTFYGYLPFQIVKRLTLIERGKEILLEVANFYDELQVSDLFEVERKYADVPQLYKKRLVKLEKLDKTERAKIVKLPWFYDCNRDRYPTWERKHDSRLN